MRKATVSGGRQGVPVGKQSWYRIENRSPDSTEVFLYDEIGVWGIPAGEFVSELRAIKTPQIDLHISSPGGEVFDGMAIFNAIRNHPAEVTVHIDGIAASAASFIAMAGDRVVAEKNATVMIHDGHGICVGNSKDMLDLAALLDKCSDNIASIYADKTGAPVAEWRERMRVETWFTAQEAKDAGLVDEVRSGKVRNDLGPQSWDLSVFRYPGRDKAPPPTNTAPTPPTPDEPTDPPDEAGFLMPGDAIRDAITALEHIPFDADTFRAAVTLVALDAPAPDPPKPPDPPPAEPELSINLPDLRRALREAQL